MVNEIYGPTSNQSTWWNYKNVFNTLANGTTGFQFVGNEIVNPMLKFKFKWIMNWANISSNNTGNFATAAINVLLVAANEQFTATVATPYPAIGSTGDPGWFYQSDGYYPTMNGNNVKVLKKWSRRVTPPGLPMNTSGLQPLGTQYVTGKMTYRFKRKLTFEDSSIVTAIGGPARATTLRGWNYYLLVGASLPFGQGTPVGTGGSAVMPVIDTFMYFKDP